MQQFLQSIITIIESYFRQEKKHFLNIITKKNTYSTDIRMHRHARITLTARCQRSRDINFATNLVDSFPRLANYKTSIKGLNEIL